MISSDKNSNIQRNQIEIAINTRDKGSPPGETPPILILPYDPNLPPDGDTTTTVVATNYLDNSDYDWSKDGYVNNPVVLGDANEECYNWYRQRFIKVTDLVATTTLTAVSSVAAPFKAAYTYPMDFVLLNGTTGGAARSGTLTRVSDTSATLSVAADNTLTGGVLWFGTALSEVSANALKASGHSTFAANETANIQIPRWDKTNGWVELGSNTGDTFDIACPLPLNLVRGGVTYFFRCIISQRAGSTLGSPVRLFVGVWDATAAEKRFIESSNLSLTVAPVGTTGATTYSYKVIADLDNGTSIMSGTTTIANGNAALSATNYNRLTWANATGVLNFRLYREVGGVVKRIFTIRNGGHDYNDYGSDEGETPASLPTSAVLRPIAYQISPAFNPTSSTAWQSILIALEIPSSYDTSRTTGKQWLRFGLEGATGSERMITLDRVMFSTSNGGWQRSARDLNKILNQNPTSMPTTTTQGGTGILTCFTLDTPVVVCEKDGSNIRQMAIGDLDKGMFVFSGATRVNRIVHIKDDFSSTIITCVLSNEIEFRCSPSERFITSRADRTGTRIDDLTIGDEILCWDSGRVSKGTIEQYIVTHDRTPVRTLSLRGGETFVAGSGHMKGAIAHNRKEVPTL